MIQADKQGMRSVGHAGIVIHAFERSSMQAICMCPLVFLVAHNFWGDICHPFSSNCQHRLVAQLSICDLPVILELVFVNASMARLSAQYEASQYFVSRVNMLQHQGAALHATIYVGYTSDRGVVCVLPHTDANMHCSQGICRQLQQGVKLLAHKANYLIDIAWSCLHTVSGREHQTRHTCTHAW